MHTEQRKLHISSQGCSDHFIWANTLPADSDNEGVADSSEWITPEDIHQMFVGIPHIISKSKNNMEEKQLGFIALYGSRRLIIRGEFEKYLEANSEIKEELKNASRKNKDTP